MAFSAFENWQNIGATENLRQNVEHAKQKNPNHQPQAAIHVVALACAKFLAARMQQQGRHESRPYRGGEAYVADCQHESCGKQQTSCQRRQKSQSGGLAAPGAAGVKSEQVAQVIQQAQRDAKKRRSNGHVGEKR